MNFKVRKRNGEVVDFDLYKIQTAIEKAMDACGKAYSSNITERLALRSAADFSDKVKDSVIGVEDIQDSVEKVLGDSGYMDVAKAYILYRDKHASARNLNYKKLVESYVNASDWRVKENSTVTQSLGGLILSNSGAVTANYWLNEIYDKEVADAHKNGDMHIHDLSMLSGYCAGWSLKQLIKEGLGGVEGKITSAPASHLSTLCNQMVNFLGIMQNEWAGAQALSSFDTYLAPFVKKDGLSYKEVKQCIQSFVYGVNTPSRWGCVSEDTEVLTNKGFKHYNELEKGDLIYTWKDGSVNLNPVREIVVKPFKGNLHVYASRNYIQMVSPEHRMLIQKHNSAECVIRRSEEIFSVKTPFALPVAFPNGSYLPKAVLTDEEIQLAGMDKKNIDDKFLAMNEQQARLFLKTWASFDGNEEKMMLQYDTDEIRDKLQQIAVLAGYTSFWETCKSANKNPSCYVKIRKVDAIYPTTRYEQPYDGVVWCPNVEDGTAIFRKDGCVYISGQCQAPFTNITIDWTVPNDLANLPCIVGGKDMDFCYKDCKPEMDMVNKAFLEIMIEGDANGRGFQYPMDFVA